MKDKPPGKGKLAEFTKPECDYFRENCNFTAEEQAVFDLCVRHRSVAYISIQLNMAERTVNRRIQSIKRKIYKVL